jgi:hypothetical protein
LIIRGSSGIFHRRISASIVTRQVPKRSSREGEESPEPNGQSLDRTSGPDPRVVRWGALGLICSSHCTNGCCRLDAGVGVLGVLKAWAPPQAARRASPGRGHLGPDLVGLEDRPSGQHLKVVQWRVLACCSSHHTNGSVCSDRKSRVVDTLSHLVSDRSSQSHAELGRPALSPEGPAAAKRVR